MPTVIDSLIVELGLDAAKFNQQQKDAMRNFKNTQDEAQRSAKGIETAANRINSVIGDIHATFGKFTLGLIGGGSLAGFAGFIGRMAGANSELGKTASSVGLSATMLDSWGKAAQKAGASYDGFVQAIKTNEEQIAHFNIFHDSDLTAQYSALSRASGVFVNSTAPVQERMNQIAEALKRLKDEGRAAEGLNYGKMLGFNDEQTTIMMEQGRALGTLANEMARINPLSQDAIKQSRELKSSWDDLERSAKGLGDTFISVFGKPLSGLLDKASESVKSGWFGGQKDPMGDFVTTILKSMGKSFPAETPATTGTPSGANDNTAPDIMRGYREKIAKVESSGSGGYGAVGPRTRTGDRAYGRYQMMGNNIGPWSKEALGREMSVSEFMNSPEAQDKIFNHRFGGYISKYGNPQDAASAWFTGRPLSGGAGAQDLYGTSGSEYVRRFNAAPGDKQSSNTTTTVHISSVTIKADSNDPQKMADGFVRGVKDAYSAQRGLA